MPSEAVCTQPDLSRSRLYAPVFPALSDDVIVDSEVPLEDMTTTDQPAEGGRPRVILIGVMTGNQSGPSRPAGLFFTNENCQWRGRGLGRYRQGNGYVPYLMITFLIWSKHIASTMTFASQKWARKKGWYAVW